MGKQAWAHCPPSSSTTRQAGRAAARTRTQGWRTTPGRLVDHNDVTSYVHACALRLPLPGFAVVLVLSMLEFGWCWGWASACPSLVCQRAILPASSYAGHRPLHEHLNAVGRLFLSAPCMCVLTCWLPLLLLLSRARQVDQHHTRGLALRRQGQYQAAVDEYTRAAAGPLPLQESLQPGVLLRQGVCVCV
jgi:hypothetical protein